MSKTLMAWAAGLVLGTASLAGPALAQTAGGSGTTAGARPDAKSPPIATQRQADAESKAAHARCNSRKGADQKTCLEEVRAQQRAKAGQTGTNRPPGTPVPAVQTQSSAVSATGVAPSTTGPDPAPGTPAVPRK